MKRRWFTKWFKGILTKTRPAKISENIKLIGDDLETKYTLHNEHSSANQMFTIYLEKVIQQELKTKKIKPRSLCEDLGNQRIAQKGLVRNRSHDSRARRRTLQQWTPRKF